MVVATAIAAAAIGTFVRAVLDLAHTAGYFHIALPGLMLGAVLPPWPPKPSGGLSKAEVEKIAKEKGSLGIATWDSRIAHTIDLTGATAADAGWGECVALAAEVNGTIMLSPNSRIKLENYLQLIPYNVNVRVMGVEQSAKFTFPKNPGTPVYSLLKAEAKVGTEKIELKEVKGAFAAAGSVFISGGSIAEVVSYTGTEGAGETITLTGVTGVNHKHTVGGTPPSVIQSVGFVSADAEIENADTFGEGILIEGPVATNAYVEAPPAVADGHFLGRGRRTNCLMSRWRMTTTITGDHQTIGSKYRGAGGNWCSGFAMLGPRVSAGNQKVEAGAYVSGGAACNIYIGDGAQLQAAEFGLQVHFGQSPYVFLASENGGTEKVFMTTVRLWAPIFESWGAALIACLNPKGYCENIQIHGSNGGQFAAPETPAGVTPCLLKAHEFRDFNWYDQPAYEPLVAAMTNGPFITDNFKGSMFGLLKVAQTLNTLGIPLATGMEETAPKHLEITGDSQTWACRVEDENIAEGSGVELREGTTYAHKIFRSEHNSPVLGVALLAAGARKCTIVQQAALGPGESFGSAGVGAVQTKVKVKEQSNPPTGLTVEKSATAGTLEARSYFVRVWALTAEGGVTAAVAQGTVVAEAGKSILIKWVAPAEIPHGVAISKYRYSVSTETGVFSGYRETAGAGLEVTYSGAAMEHAGKLPPERNEGCEIFGIGYVRDNGPASPGAFCSASGPNDANGEIIGGTYKEPDNGQTALITMRRLL